MPRCSVFRPDAVILRTAPRCLTCTGSGSSSAACPRSSLIPNGVFSGARTFTFIIRRARGQSGVQQHSRHQTRSIDRYLHGTAGSRVFAGRGRHKTVRCPSPNCSSEGLKYHSRHHSNDVDGSMPHAHPPNYRSRPQQD